MRKKNLLYFLGILVFVILVRNYTVALEKTIVIEGRAAGTDLKARDAAIRDALRAAVEQAVGVALASTSAVKDFQLLYDLIRTQATGYVRSYDIISERKENNEYYVKIRATVNSEKLQSDLLAKGLLYTLKEKPLIMVVISEKIDSVEQTSFNVGSKLESVLLQEGMELVDRSQIEQIKARDIELNYQDPERAAALGKRYGADIVIIGEANADYADTQELLGSTIDFYQTNVDVKVVRTDTGTILAVESVTVRKGTRGKVPAARFSLNEAGKELAKKLVPKIWERWRKEVYNQTDYQLIVNVKDHNRLSAFETSLKNLRGVEGVYRRLFLKNVAILNVDYAGNINELSRNILTLSAFKPEITAASQNRLELTVY